MEASRYFERTLFYDRGPDVDEYYENSADRIFEKDVSKVQIEVRLQPCSDGAQGQLEVEDNHYGKQRYDSDFEERKVPSVRESSSGPIKQAGSISIMKNQRSTTSNIGVDTDDNVDTDDDGSSMISLASSTALPSAMDQRQGECDPPLYPGLPKLAKHYLAPGDIETFVKATKSDFRVFYLRQRHSFSQLQITKEAFERLLIACRVFPRFNEYVIEFGRKKNETEVGPPPLKYRSICTTTSNLWRGFECSYILRYVEKTDRPGGRHPWSLRQFAVYHRFKPASSSQCSTWILVGASKRTELRLDRYTRSVDDVYKANPFELHVIFLDTVIANWRPYLAYLGRLVQEQSGRSSGYSEEDDFVTIEVEDHQQLKQIEDWMADLLLCLDSTMDTLATFMDMYEDFRQRQSSHRHSSASSDIIAVAFQTKAKEIAYTRKKAESLLSRIQNTRTLVSSLLERQSGRNINQQIQALQKLEQQGQNENAIMRDLAEKNARDSSSMRILTIITMVYLPCTIVSNFYSTQFVNQVETRAGHMTLEYTSNAWIFFAISIPLTFFTIFVWFLWVNSDSMVRLLRDKHSRKMFQSTHFFRVRRSLDKLPQ